MSVENELLATCYLGRASDNNNKCYLTTEKLVVRYKRNDYDFQWENIQSIGFGKRKLMLFLLIGGVSASFSIIGYIKFYLHPISVLILLFAGSLLFYFGYAGKYALYVEEKHKTTDFLLTVVTPNLTAFIKFTNQYLYQVVKGGNTTFNFSIYHIIEKKVWEKVQTQQWYNAESLEKEGFIHCLHQDQIGAVRDKHNLIVLKIDPLKVHAEIRYEKGTGTDELFPHIYGPLNLDSIISEQEDIK